MFNLPQILYSPDEEGGGAVTPSDGGAPASDPAPSSPESAPESTPASGGLRDATSDGDFVMPDSVGWGDDFEVEIPADLGVVPEQTPAGQPQTPAEVTPVQTPSQQPPAQPQPPQAAQEQTPQPPQGQPAPQEFPSDPGQLAAMLQQNRNAVIDQIAQQHFQLTPEEVKGLEEDAVHAIPRLLAKTHVDAVSTMLSHLGNLVPQMMMRHTMVMNANQSAEQAFFKAHPHLVGHEDQVMQIARNYRAVNPNASLADVIQNVGILASNILKVQPQAAKPNGQAPARPQPFVPGIQGSGGPPQQAPENPFAGLGRDFD